MAKNTNTVFKIRDVRNEGEDAKFRRTSRKVFRITNRKNSEENLPFRVGTQYEGGRAIKLTTLLPKPAGWGT